ncbi:MAG: hypothetical protein B7X04_02620 [Parcubacteria group bacterium 21-54-25]|nr:MAG: hypothetical protein B7X04_02620 [Parcubacteria group bacterium 21-54-25]HQU07754.1 hypothetical protein [Candidatus Paceibacterota bacterium]
MTDAQHNDEPRTDASLPKRVVRTYASDLAALQGNNVPVSGTTKPPAATPPPPRAPIEHGEAGLATSPPKTPPKPEVVQTPIPPPPTHTPEVVAPPAATKTRLAPPPRASSLPEKQKERPEIPVDLVLMNRRPLAEQESHWSKLWSSFASKSSDVETNIAGAPVIHEDIKVADSEPAPAQREQVAVSPVMTSPSISSPQQKAPANTKPAVQSAPYVPPPTTGYFSPPQPFQQPQGTENEPREEILARLRAKVARERRASDQLVEKSVLPEEKRASVLAPAASTQTPVFATQPDELSPLHTYKTDFVDHLQQTQASTVSVLAAEHDAGQAPTKEAYATSRSYTLLWAISGILLLIIGIGGVFYAYYYHVGLSAPVATVQTAPSLIATDGSVRLSGTGGALMNALANAANTASLSDGSVELTYITIATTTATGATTTISVPGGYLIAALRLPLPNILANNIAADSTVGIVRASGETRPFFLLHVASYDAAFAGMLSWERTMATDLAPLYPPYPTATSTATTTVRISSGAATASSFVDEVVANHDTRVLRDAAGRSIMLYGFRDKNTVIIARNAAAFTAILNRLNNTSAQ